METEIKLGQSRCRSSPKLYKFVPAINTESNEVRKTATIAF